MKHDIRERLKTDVLLADGAMGTLLVSRGARAREPALAALRRRSPTSSGRSTTTTSRRARRS